jgi:hypothetical protein
MASPTFDDLFRRALDLNLRYYGALGRLTADYLRDAAAAFSELGGLTQTPSATPRSGPGQASHTGPVMVLEAEAGGTAMGVFLVENQLPHEVNAAMVSSSFTSARGRQARIPLVFDPPRVSLKPGEQILVRIQATLTEDLEPDVRYSGEITVPELRGTRIPTIIRRRSPDPTKT